MSEALVQYALTPYYEPIPADTTCACCGATQILVRDHCHEHGWVRDIVCRCCNAYLAIVDRRIMPGVSEELLAALLAVRNHCKDCKPLGAADLERRVRPASPAKPVWHSEEPKAHENRLRRMATRRGYRLVKTRRIDPLAVDYGTYHLVPAKGKTQGPFKMDEIEQWLTAPRR